MKKNNIILIKVFASVSFLLHSCSSNNGEYSKETGGSKGRLVITGSSTVAPLASEISKRFEASHPEAQIDVQSGGSERGISDTRQGIADIGMVSRSLRRFFHLSEERTNRLVP